MPRKWDQDSTPSEKLLMLFALLLFNDRYYSLTELTGIGYLNSSKASIGRLIKQLERTKVGNVKKEKRGKEVFYKLERPKRLPLISLNADGFKQLVLCRDFLTKILPERMQLEMDASLNQAAVFLPADSHQLPPRIGASLSKGHIDYTPYQHILDILIKGILQKNICEVEYKSAKGNKGKSYNFAPKKILIYNGCLYAEGWLVTDGNPPAIVHDDPLRLAVQRFLKCTLTNKPSSELPETVSNSDKAMGIMQDKQFEVKLWFSSSVATYVAERVWSEGQNISETTEGAIILTAKMANKRECISWILGFGDNVKILYPPWLIEDFRKILNDMLKLNDDTQL